MMRKLRSQLLLMCIAILGIAAFQFFWLRQTFLQERKTLSIKASAAFKDVVQQLQISKLHIDSIPGDTLSRKLKFISTTGMNEEFNVQLHEKKGLVTTVNVIRKKISDSTGTYPVPGRVMVAREKTFDTLMLREPRRMGNNQHLIKLLYGVDSLQEPITLTELRSKFATELKRQRINIPIDVQQFDANYNEQDDEPNAVTIGFARPKTYAFKAGNTYPYLLRQIAIPIAVSLLLLTITVVSFVLLYRNLLRQHRLTEIKNEFIGNMTHELKTPIATVSVAIEAMRNFNALNDPQRTAEYLDISTNELQRLSLLVDKVLSLSKFQKNEIEISKQHFDLSQLIRDILDSMKPQFEKQDATVTVEASGSNFIIEADERHISSVVYNLIDNAMKYSNGHPQIQVRLIDQQEYMELQVRDNGIGIPSEYSKKIFDQFFRVPHGDRYDIKGYGLGLSYVNYIVKRHHGIVEVESEPGKGSTFIVKLPFSESEVIRYDKNRTIRRNKL